MKEGKLLDMLPDGIILVDCNGTIVSVNKAALDILGLSSEEVTEKIIWDDPIKFSDQSGIPFSRDNHPVAISLRTNIGINKIILSLENMATRQKVWIRCTITLRDKISGKVRWKAIMHFTAITEILEIEERYNALFDKSPFTLALNELDTGRYRDVNQKFCADAHARKEEIIGKTAVELGYLPNPRLDKALRKMLISNSKVEQFEQSYFSVDGVEVISLIWAQIITILGKKYSLTALQDITDRKKAEEELRVSKAKYKSLYEQLVESREQLRALAAHLQNVREEERMLIARDIHDDLGHLLTVMKLDLEECKLSAGYEPARLAEKIEPIIELVNSGIVILRKIATELRPGILDHFGLIPAIEWLINQFQVRTKIACSYFFEKVTLNLSKESSSNVFRIFQEVFTNIARHSMADKVTVSLTKRNDHFAFTIKDNGVGFTMGKNTGKMSFGILGMKERALSIGAEFSIKSKPGSGTKISLILFPETCIE